MATLSELIHGGPVTPEEATRVRDIVVFEPPQFQEKLIRFGILLTLAAAISTYGLINDSVATVIGAMIVAPLMLPIVGLAFSISIGDVQAIFRSLLVGAGGITAAIAVGWLLAQLLPSSFDPEQVGQIMSRTSPKLVDMLAALATGLAGAFAVGRKDVSDTLPGVAIAISLVPPLANVGILLATGHPALARGSLLLFVTNYLAIVLTASFVFGIMGYSRMALETGSRRGKRVGVAVAVVMSCAIMVPLAVQSISVWVDHSSEATASSATRAWLEGSGYELQSVTTKPGNSLLDIVIAGSGPVPPEADLESALAGKVGGKDVVLEVVPAERSRLATAADTAPQGAALEHGTQIGQIGASARIYLR